MNTNGTSKGVETDRKQILDVHVEKLKVAACCLLVETRASTSDFHFSFLKAVESRGQDRKQGTLCNRNTVMEMF